MPQSDERIECVGCGKPDRVVKGEEKRADGSGSSAAIYPEGWGLVYFESRPLPVCSAECRSKAHAEKWRLRLAVNREVEKEKRVRVEAFSELARASAAKAFCTCPTCISNRRYGTDVPCSREAEVAARAIVPNGGSKGLDVYAVPPLTPERRAAADAKIAEAREREAREVAASAPRCGTCVYFALHGDGTGTCGHHATAKPITPEDVCGAYRRASTAERPELRCALDTLLANDPASRGNDERAIAARVSTRKTCRCGDCEMWRVAQERPTNPATANPFVRDGDATVVVVGKEPEKVDNSAHLDLVAALAKEGLKPGVPATPALPIPLPVVAPAVRTVPARELMGEVVAAMSIKAPWKPSPGATVYHKLTGAGPWVAVKAEELETLRSAPDPRGKNGELLKLTTIATWTVSTESGKFLAVPEALLAPNPPPLMKPRVRALFVAVAAFTAACALRLAWAWFVGK